MGNEAVVDTNLKGNGLANLFNYTTKMIKEHKHNELDDILTQNYGDYYDHVKNLPDEEPEKKEKFNVKNIISSFTPGFLFKRENGEIKSEPVIITEDHPDYETDVVNIVVNNPTVKELKLNIRPEDVMINSDGKIVVRIFHNGVPEIYRFDIIQDKLYVQAPLNKEYINFNDRMIYKFVTVPINSIEGKNIVTNPNYFVDLDAINSDTAPGVIFRINDTAI